VDILRDPQASDCARRFLECWYGGRGSVSAQAPEGLDGLPAPLRQLHELVATWPEAISHNHLYSPSETKVVDGRLVFAAENQTVVEWATDPFERDGAVWTLTNPEKEWMREPSSLSRFCVELLVFDAATNAPFGVWADESGERTDEVLRSLTRLPLGPWTWPEGTSFHARERLLGMVFGDAAATNVAGRQFWLGALDPHALAFLDGISGPDDPLESWGDGWEGPRTRDRSLG